MFEQADRLKEVGAGIQITPNSTRILRALGLEDAVRKRGFEPGFMLTRDMTHRRSFCSEPRPKARWPNVLAPAGFRFIAPTCSTS